MEALDLFCGCGGFSKGFELAGINVVYGVDVDGQALQSFSHNHEAEAINYDISQEVPNKLREDYDLIFGSPPCQSLSSARGERDVSDDKNNLVFDFIRWVDELQPKYVVMENVLGIENISNGFVTKVLQTFDEAGYDIDKYHFDASDYGVPQKRKRVIFMGSRKDVSTRLYPPQSTHKPPSNQRTLSDMMDSGGKPDKVTVNQAFVDLPDETIDASVRYKHSPMNEFQEWVRQNSNRKVLHHQAKKSDKEIVDRIPEGMIYRSTRFGERYIPVWKMFEDKFTEDEQSALKYIGKNREEGDPYIDRNELDTDVQNLLDDGWLREEDGKVDLNTKSGVRNKYMRLDREKQARTIDTQSFQPRNRLHPTENRGISLREGARLQSFPDNFRFFRDFNEIATQIGNAVPPRMAEEIGKMVLEVSR